MTSKAHLPDIATVYFRRFGYKPRLIDEPVHPETKLILVIPCYDEPDLLTTLKSLSRCLPPQYPVEVIVVINAGIEANRQVLDRNRKTREQIMAWLAENRALSFTCHLLYFDDLPKKHAGVGLARKIGMDEALRRFASIPYTGLIVCLDADCTVAENYLIAIEEKFLSVLPSACGIYFEHPLDKTEEELRHGIVQYELFLRYYVNAVRYTGFPFAMHTMGSGMAVRADVYAKTGGMNRRKAGEDFYFLHKVAPHRHFVDINNTTVYPSARISHRVPFGTGKAQADWQQDRSRLWETYHFQIFEDLKLFLNSHDALYGTDMKQVLISLYAMPASIQAFLEQQDFEDKLKEIRNNTTGMLSFKKRFFGWFDGFRVLKFVHFARDHFYLSMPLEEAALMLLKKLGKETPEANIAEALLKAYRRLDRQR